MGILKIFKRRKSVKFSDGCLAGKTKAQKESFFQSLFFFTSKDPVFFREQFDDLKGEEQKEFIFWLDEKRKRNLLQFENAINLIKSEYTQRIYGINLNSKK